ncbi:hypothetical protein CMV_009948 [Castanea mollissima]|uniref:Uncharacterized protein n=1 Tax=Castanea mollissima TaxID=60419 RepID=A0A8J4RK27_9ROSI|nr:hypothetical protein CMV_009948 [Castanea mollissima]
MAMASLVPPSSPLSKLKIMTVSFGEDEVPLLDDWPSNLMSLKKLKIWSSPGLTSLPEAVRYLTSLRSLAFQELPKLEQKLVGNGPRQHKYRDLNVLQKDDVVQNVSIGCLHHVCISLLFILKYCKANQELEFRKYEYTSMSLLTLQVGDEH